MVTSTGGQAVSLVHDAAEGDGRELRVRSPDAIHVRALGGNLTLGGEPLSGEGRILERSSSWRGYTNVTTLTVQGEGRLLVAANGTGLLVPVDRPWQASNETGPPGGEDREEAARPDRGDRSPAGAPGTTQRPAPAEGGGPARDDEAPAPTGEGSTDGLPVDPALAGLSLTAVGAFAVEAYTRWRDED
ncbi:hypothetical protein BRD56_10995 [Thermoplasmatales archaeon SW_10_69_26]|nr:MAG: hypothetical protein BRD56_10995 [Thermoplasmatales archaeon SW_10_69_26]